jgi:hypothetical protein
MESFYDEYGTPNSANALPIIIKTRKSNNSIKYKQKIAALKCP